MAKANYLQFDVTSASYKKLGEGMTALVERKTQLEQWLDSVERHVYTYSEKYRAKVAERIGWAVDKVTDYELRDRASHALRDEITDIIAEIGVVSNLLTEKEEAEIQKVFKRLPVKFARDKFAPVVEEIIFNMKFGGNGKNTFEQPKPEYPLISKINAAKIKYGDNADSVDGFCALRESAIDMTPMVDRVDPDTKKVSPSIIDVVRSSESICSFTHGGHMIINGERVSALFELLEISCGELNEKDADSEILKDVICAQNVIIPKGYSGVLIDPETKEFKGRGVAVPYSVFEGIGYIPRGTQMTLSDGIKYVIYRVALCSASAVRQCKVTSSSLDWDEFVGNISADALCLSVATKNIVKASKYLGLAKTGGRVVKGLDFNVMRLPDLYREIETKVKSYYVAKDKKAWGEFVEEIRPIKRDINDGHGWISLRFAKVLSLKLGLNYTPSAFQIRYGQVKGIVVVFDYAGYTKDPELANMDMLLTESMWKEEFDVSKAEFLVANLSKPQTQYCLWNYQMMCALNSQLKWEDILPHVTDVKNTMEKALTSIEDALNFLRVVSTPDVTDSGKFDLEESQYADALTAGLQASHRFFLTQMCKYSILGRIERMSEKMLRGKVPMQGSISMFCTDPIDFFNCLYKDVSVKANMGYDVGTKTYRYNFDDRGFKVMNPKNEIKPLAAGEFYYGGKEGKVLGMRTPLTHWAQVREFNCVNDSERAKWYAPLNQMMVFNNYDCTAVGMGGADFDGDFGFFTELFVSKFKVADYIIYNNNELGGKEKCVLTHEALEKHIRAGLNKNRLGMIVNANTIVMELLNDEKALRKFVSLVSHKKDVYTFGDKYIKEENPVRVFADNFSTVNTARVFLEQLNHMLTTMSEVEVDIPNHGFRVFFDMRHQIPFMPLWFGMIKDKTHNYFEFDDELIQTNDDGMEWRRYLRKEQALPKEMQETFLTPSDAELQEMNKFEKDKLGRDLLENHMRNTQWVKMLVDTYCLCKQVNEKGKTAPKLNPDGSMKHYVRRAVKLFMDTDSIMNNLYKYVRDNILTLKVPHDACQNIEEALATSDLLNMEEVDRIRNKVAELESKYRKETYALYVLQSKGEIDEDEYTVMYNALIEDLDTACRKLTDDRVALAYASYMATIAEKNTSKKKTFPLKVALDGLVALLKSTNDLVYEPISLDIKKIPANATHVIVYNKRVRLQESVDSTKTYFADANLPNGTYELHWDIFNNSVSVIVARKAKKSENTIPVGVDTPFQVKVSYKISELEEQHRNGIYVTSLFEKANEITFEQTTTEDGNVQYIVKADDIWVGTIFKNTSNYISAMEREAVRVLIGNKFTFEGVPEARSGKNHDGFDNNGFYQKNGETLRDAQVLRFRGIYSGPSAEAIEAAHTSNNNYGLGEYEYSEEELNLIAAYESDAKYYDYVNNADYEVDETITDLGDYGDYIA